MRIRSCAIKNKLGLSRTKLTYYDIKDLIKSIKVV